MTIRPTSPSEIRLSDLPLDLLCLPLMLILLSWLSTPWAMFAVVLIALALIASYHKEGRLGRSKLSLIGFALQCGGFALVAHFFSAYLVNALAKQVLWIVIFLILHALAAITIKRNKFPKLDGPTCSCDRRRNETLIAEYVRFDKLLVKLSLIALALYIPIAYLTPEGSVWELVFSHLLALASLAVILIELYHLAWLRKHLKAESWIPILGEQHTPVGRVSRSDVEKVAGIVPRVRLLAISQGMIYLERCPMVCCTDEWAYDTPFSDWLSEDDSPESTAQRMIDARFCGIRRVRPKKLFPYRIEHNQQQQLIHLMVVEIEEPSQLYIDCRPVEGKWWSVEQLKPLLSESDFSDYLPSELDICEQTIFLAQRLREKSS